MRRTHRQQGITLSGFIYVSIIVGIIAVVGMKLFPLYNEKMKVDMALKNVAEQAEAATLPKSKIVDLVSRQFEVSEVRRWSQREFSKVLKIQRAAGGKGKTMNLNYEIRGPFFGPLDVVLNYDNTLPLGKKSTD